MQDPEKLTADQTALLIDQYETILQEGYLPQILCTISTLQELMMEHIHHAGKDKFTPMHIHSIYQLRALFEVPLYLDKY